MGKFDKVLKSVQDEKKFKQAIDTVASQKTVKPLINMPTTDTQKRIAMEQARLKQVEKDKAERERLGRIAMGIDKGTKEDVEKANKIALNTPQSAFAMSFLDPLRATDINKSKEYQQARLKAETDFAGASTAGSLAGMLVPGSLAGAGLKLGTKALRPVTTATSKVVTPLLGKGAGTLASKVVEGGILGTGFTAAQNITPLLKGTKDVERVGEELKTGLVTGAALDVGLYGLGKLARPLIDKISQGIALSQAEKQAVAQTLNVPVDNVDETVDKIRPTLGRGEGLTQTTPQPTVKPLLQATESPTQTFIPNLDVTPAQTIKPLIGDSTQLKDIALQDGGFSTTVDIPKPKTYEPKTGEGTATVLTQMPKRDIKLSVNDKLRGVYQGIVTKDLPLETIGKTYEPVRNLTATARKSGGTVNYYLENKQVDMTGNEIGDSLVGIFKKVKKNDIQDLYDYAMHKHNVDRYAQNKPVFGDDVNSEMSQQIASNIEQAKPQVKELQQELNQYTKNLKDNWLVKSGILSEESAKQLDELYPNYLPTNRAKDTINQMQTFGSKGSVKSPIKKATGSNKDILPIDQQLATLTNNVIRASRKNELYNSLAQAFEKNPNVVGRFFKPISKEKADLTEGIEGLIKTYDEPIKKLGDTYELNFYQNGEKVKAEISKDMYEALKPMGDLSNIEKVLEGVNKFATKPFKELVTGKNLLFMASNIMRDFPTAFVNSNDAIKWTKNIPVAIKEIATNGKAWREYQALGGTQGNIFTYDQGFKSPLNANQNIVSKAVQKTLKPIETIGNVTEAVPRFAEYLATVEKGGGTYQSKLEGMYRAAEITTDFSRGGDVTKSLDKVVPYLNPSVQGIDKFVRQLSKKPLQTIVKSGLTMTFPTVVLDQINKTNQKYQELSPREKNSFFHIPWGDGFIRIPKSRENGLLFSTLYTWLARRSRGEEVTVDEVLSAMSESLPVNPIENSIITPAIKGIKQLTDEDADMVNYAGISIVPESLKRLPKGEQYDQYTSGVAKAIGKQLDLSPKVIDYLMRSYGGIVAQTLLPKTSPTQSSVVGSKFYTDPEFKSGLQNKVYDLLDKAEKKNNSNKLNDIKDRELERQLKMIRAVTKDLSEYKKEQKVIDASKLPKFEKEKKIKELQIKMNDVARELLKKQGEK